MEKSNNITWGELRYILPFLGGMITIIFFFAYLSFKIDSLQNAQLDIRTQIQRLSDNQDAFKLTQATQGLDIAVIKNILQHNNLSSSQSAQKKTLASSSTSPIVGRSVTPTPNPLALNYLNSVKKKTIIAQSSQPMKKHSEFLSLNTQKQGKTHTN